MRIFPVSILTQIILFQAFKEYTQQTDLQMWTNMDKYAKILVNLYALYEKTNRKYFRH